MHHSDTAAAAIIAADPQARLALQTIAQLSEAGFIGYLAGGCVRDALLDRRPKDYDVATNARPDQIQQLFGPRRTLAIGVSFGVVSVLPERRGEFDPVEVATFRSDGAYTDGRRPDVVHFSTPELDAHRRDFTINGMFFDPLAEQVIDFVGGHEDLAQRQLRAIGDPVARFAEDKLRLLRAVRFATTYNFAIEPVTFQAVREHAADVTVCSGERIGAEMRRLLANKHADRGIELLLESQLAAAIMPRLNTTFSDPQRLNSLQALLRELTVGDFPARLAGLAGSADEAAATALDELASNWRLSNEELAAAHTAIKYLSQLLRADQLAWSELQPLLVSRHSSCAIELARATIASTHTKTAAWQRLAATQQLPPSQLNPPPLLTGADLIALGLRPGPEFKRLLERARAAQLDGEISSATEALSAIAERRWMDPS